MSSIRTRPLTAQYQITAVDYKSGPINPTIYPPPPSLSPPTLVHSSLTVPLMAAANVPAVVSSPPSAGPVPQHPPYKEMIVRAIESLKGKNGSSRTTISKFISVNYCGLPPNHEMLLSTHIHRLKKNGVITTMKQSHMMADDISWDTNLRVAAEDSSRYFVVVPKHRGRLAKSDPTNLAAPLRKQGRILKPVVTGRRRGCSPKMAIVADVEGSGVKRRSERLAKVARFVSGDVVEFARKRRPGRPTKIAHPVSGHAKVFVDVEGSGVQRRSQRLARVAHLVSGDVVEFAKKKMPERSTMIAHPMSEYVDGSVGKRKPGRSAKVAYLVSGDVEGSVGKRKPGWPSKVVHPVSEDVKGSVEKRKPGRPAKIVHPVSGDVEGSVQKKKLGRPAKIVHPVSGDVEGSVQKKKLGRPAKIVHPVFADVEGSVGKRKPGRPTKTANLEPGDVEGSVSKRKPGRPVKKIR